MSRVVKDQIIASTSLDSHGERLPEAVLRSYFEQMVEGAVGASSHDLSQKPAFRSFNKRLVRTSAGDLAIMVDVEVLDEERYTRFGGFSISFTRRRQRFGQAPSYPRVTINTRQFKFDAVAADLNENLRTTPFELVERVEKIDVATLAIIGIVAGAYLVGKVTVSAITSTFSGFFEEAGKDLYHAVKRLVRADQSNGPVEIQFQLHVHEPPKRPVIIIRVDPRCTPTDIGEIDSSKLERLLEGIDLDAFDRLTAELRPGGQLKSDVVISNNGEQLTTGKKKQATKRKKRRRH